jgi:ribosomal protein S18 acetylase RimI-like enzyme
MERIEPLNSTQAEVASAIHEVMVAAYRVEAELLGVADFVPLHRGVEAIRDAGSRFLGAFRDGELVGVAELEDEPDGTTNVASLVVRPPHFRRGIATALLHHVIARHGAGAITVSTGRRNAPALALYAGFGFDELRRWATVDGIPMVTLRRAGGG